MTAAAGADGGGGVRITWSSASRAEPLSSGAIQPDDIFPEASGLVLRETEDPIQPIGRAGRRASPSSAEAPTPRRSRAAVDGGSGGSDGIAPHPPTVPRLDLAHAQRPATATGADRSGGRDSPRPRAAVAARPHSAVSTKLSLSIRQTAQARTVARINGVARYRKYRALSEQIARTMPKEELHEKLVQPPMRKTAPLPAKLPYKVDSEATPRTVHQEQARQLAKQEMAADGGAAADAAQTSLLLKRHRSYSSPGAPDASVTPRPGAQRLQRTVTEGFLNEFMLPRHSAEQSPVYKPTPQGPSALNSPRAYHRRLAATSAPGSHLPAQEVIGDVDPKRKMRHTATVVINRERIEVDILGGKHPIEFQNEVRAMAQKWIRDARERYLAKCEREFGARVAAARSELEPSFGCADPGSTAIVALQIRKRLQRIAEHTVKRDQQLELEWLHVQQWNLTRVGNYFAEKHRRELQLAAAQRVYDSEIVPAQRRARKDAMLQRRVQDARQRQSFKGSIFATKSHVQKQYESVKDGLAEEDAAAASHVARAAEMKAKERSDGMASTLGRWAARASKRVLSAVEQEAQERAEAGKAAHQVYIAECHNRKALECHSLQPMLAQTKVALKDDILFPNHLQALGACFRALPHLRHLVLKSGGMDDATLEVLLAEIWGIALEQLELPSNYFSHAACHLIAAMLLGQPHPRDGSLPAEGARGVSGMATSLTVLNLSDNPVGDKGVYALADVFARHPTLRVLNMSRANLTDLAAPGLEKILCQAARLDTLDLSWNKLGTQAGRALGAGLFYTRSLTSLNLGYNSLQNGGTAAIAEALRFHPACPLRTLNLSAARMQSEGYLYLAAMVKYSGHCLGLERLTLSFSMMDSVGAQCFMRAVGRQAPRRTLRVDMENCTFKHGEPPDILKGALNYNKDAAHGKGPTSDFVFDLSSPKERALARFLVEHELEGYQLGRLAVVRVALQGRCLRRGGHPTNEVDPFDIVRAGWAESLPTEGELELSVLNLPPEPLLEAMRASEPAEWHEDSRRPSQQGLPPNSHAAGGAA